MKNNLSPSVGAMRFAAALIVTSLTHIQSANAGSNVVVIPMFEDDLIGNATKQDVLVDKTFSNASDAGIAGARPLTPLHTSRQFTCVNNDGVFDPALECSNEQEASPSYNPPLGTNVATRWERFQYVTYDRSTGLVWEAVPSPTPMTHTEATNRCQELSLEVESNMTLTNWRLPTVVELFSLVDFGMQESPLVYHQPASNYPALPFEGIKTEKPNDHEYAGDHYWTMTVASAYTAADLARYEQELPVWQANYDAWEAEHANDPDPGGLITPINPFLFSRPPEPDFFYYSVGFKDGDISLSRSRYVYLLPDAPGGLVVDNFKPQQYTWCVASLHPKFQADVIDRMLRYLEPGYESWTP